MSRSAPAQHDAGSVGPSWSVRDREAALAQLAEEPFDLLIVGGGITGAAIARAGAARALRVGLVERGDFGAGTSSHSSRLIHGGLRYLAQGQIGVVWQMRREQAHLAQTAPHLARRQPFLLPLYDRGPAPPWAVSALVWAYHRLCPVQLALPWARLSAAQVRSAEPLLTSRGLRGGWLYEEFLTHDARLVFETLLAARESGAVIASHVEFAEVVTSRGRVVGGLLRDRLGGRTIHTRARVVVNAAGPWSDDVLGLCRVRCRRLHLSKGVHLIVPRSRLPLRIGVNLIAPRDHRPLAAIPVEEFVLVGPTETEYAGPPDAMRCEPEDEAYLLEALDVHFPDARLTGRDVIARRVGLRPLYDPAVRPAGEVSRAYHIEWEEDGLLSVLGGKLTLHRRAAAAVLAAVASHLPAAGAPPGALPPLPGARWDRSGEQTAALLRALQIPPDAAAHLLSVYGSRGLQVARTAAATAGGRDPIVPGLPYLWGEAAFAIGQELALVPEDFLQRRGDLGLRAAAVGREIPARLRALWTQAEAVSGEGAHDEPAAGGRQLTAAI